MNHDYPVHYEKAHRCSICNCVNVADIETDVGDFRDFMSFTPDPSNGQHFICIDCADAIQDIRDEYAMTDEDLEDDTETRREQE